MLRWRFSSARHDEKSLVTDPRRQAHGGEEELQEVSGAHRSMAQVLLPKLKEEDDPAEGQDGHAGGVDDGREFLDAEAPQVADGEGRVGDVGRLQLVGGCPVGQLAAPYRQGTGCRLVGVRDHRGDDRVVHCHGQGNVDLSVGLDAAALPARVHAGVLLQGGGDRGDDQVGVGELDLVRLLDRWQ